MGQRNFFILLWEKTKAMLLATSVNQRVIGASCSVVVVVLVVTLSIVGAAPSGQAAAADGAEARLNVEDAQAVEPVSYTHLDVYKRQLLRGVQRNEIERGQVLAKPGTIHPHTHFNSEVYVLTKEEGGRHTPFFDGYRPQFYFRTTDVTGVIKFPEGVEMVMPGGNVKMERTLITPIAIEKGLRFAIREGGRTVGSGVVADVLE